MYYYAERMYMHAPTYTIEGMCMYLCASVCVCVCVCVFS